MSLSSNFHKRKFADKFDFSVYINLMYKVISGSSVLAISEMVFVLVFITKIKTEIFLYLDYSSAK